MYRPGILFQRHISGKNLMLLLSDELSLPARHRVEKHIAECRRCHLRYEELQRASQAVTDYSESCAAQPAPRRSIQRDLLFVRLNRLLREAASPPDLLPQKNPIHKAMLPDMNPTFATAMVLAFASVVCIFVWLQQGKPSITSNTLLVRAETWDSASPSSAEGVIRQRIGIKTPKQRVYRTIYRDTRGQRHTRPQTLSYDDEQLKNTLASAGVTWDAPLSATAYQDWHDRQRVRQDTIQQSGKNLILTTTVPDGFIAEQSFTVRNSDFHPIQRTVVFRDRGTIEIAELEYQVMPWNEVSTSFFEVPGIAHPDQPVLMQPSLVPHLPSVVSGAELDEAELSIRLVLNQLKADTGEQIQIERGPQRVSVKGLLETDERKNQLQRELDTIPNVSVSLLSMEELSKHAEPAAAVSDGPAPYTKAQPSPLETFYLGRGNNISTVSDISEKLMNHALTIDQESRAITSLMTRFGSDVKMTDLASATLSELIFSHREQLLQALRQEQDLLEKIQPDAMSPVAPAGKAVSLVAASSRNLSLCKELTLGGSSPSRSTDSILSDLRDALEEVRSTARATRLTSQPGVAAGGVR